MTKSDLILHMEALIFASEKPLSTLELTELINNTFETAEEKISPDEVEAALQAICEKYSADIYPFEVKQCGGGWQFLTRPKYYKTVAQLNKDKYLKKLSAASMETLAIIAYKQPVSKAEIEAIRGVSCDYAIQKLLEKELIIISGRNEKAPGQPLLYSTSSKFMDYFGINSPGELPRLKEVLPNEPVESTSLKTTSIDNDNTEKQNIEDADNTTSLAVNEGGELVVNKESATGQHE